MNTAASAAALEQQHRIAVRLLVWGTTDEHAEQAARRAAEGESRKGWDFVIFDRAAGPICPIDILDPKVIAADGDHDWAYAVYRAEYTLPSPESGIVPP